MGRPQLEAPSEGRFSAQLSAFEAFMREERDLSLMTIRTRHEQLRPFLHTLERVRHVRSLKEITPRHIDRYFIEQSENGWSRASLATLASTLRGFFRYAEAQRWCPSGLAAAIDSPTLYAQESLPRGPEWPEVKALVFLAIKAPRRALWADGVSAIVRWRLHAIGVKGAPCGAHGLRHACARHLLAKGFSFKQIGNQLGHRRAATTSYYAKVDLKGLREVAELSLGRLA